MSLETERPQEHNFVLVKKDVPLDEGLIIVRRKGNGVVLENFCAIIVDRIFDNKVDIRIAKITGFYLSSICAPEKYSIDMNDDFSYIFEGTNFAFKAFTDGVYLRNRVKLKFLCPEIVILRDELIERSRVFFQPNLS